MNFFEHQEQARNSTRKLVLLFVCAVFSLIVATSLLVYFLLFYAESKATSASGIRPDIVFSDVFLLVSLGVVAVVGLAALFRLGQLRGGGKVVAESMRGRLINSATRNADERKVLNVVEEMAIASGVPVPPVYIMDDPAINAFAAGDQVENAVIGVTRGCIQQLSRDELQGVIAHEFSHILHGDMRLNIRLIGVLYGIMVLGLLGNLLLRGGFYSSLDRRNRGGVLVFLGLGLVVIGFGGTFFGNLIKSAVSRQREFLADASAVQFTRNPAGIAGALKKIGGYKEGSRLQSVDASEVSHMLFEEGVSMGFSSLFATHPPLDERIRRIEPGWKGGRQAQANTGYQAADASAGFAAATASSEPAAAPSSLDSIGQPGDAHVAMAAQQLGRLSAHLVTAAHEPFGARMIAHSLIIHHNRPDIARQQVECLQQALPAQEFSMFCDILQEVSSLPRDLALPLLELSMPSLKQLSREQYLTFMSRLGQLMVLGREVSLFEWSIFKILRYHLDEQRPQQYSQLNLQQLHKPCQTLLSAMAVAGQAGTASRRAGEAFQAGAAELKVAGLSFNAEVATDIEQLEQAVSALHSLKPRQKPQLLKALVCCINSDNKVTAEEGELIRAVAAVLDCPMPPLLKNQAII